MARTSADKFVLITGANRGIGLEIARQLARRDYHVILGARNEAAGREAAEGIVASGGKATMLPLDVSSPESIFAAAETYSHIARQLDVLINNAGIYPDSGQSILASTREQMLETLQTNALGPLQVVQAFLPFLKGGTRPRIINVSSGYGQIGRLTAGGPSYSLSKLALNGLTLMLADALRGDQISVNAMSPGWVRTAMGGAGAARSVEEGADTAVWLADEADQELTGRFIRDRKIDEW